MGFYGSIFLRGRTSPDIMPTILKPSPPQSTTVRVRYSVGNHRRKPSPLIYHQEIINLLRRPVESAQYVSIRYTDRLATAGIEPSVGSVGDSYDNALAETINGLYKAELIHRRGPWRSFDAVEFATLEWVDWFNHRRLMGPIGNIPPAEAEQRYYASLERPAWVA